MPPAERPFNYTIRESARARRVRLKVSPTEGVCVVVPKGFDQSGVPGLVAKKQAWIEKTLRRLGDAPAPLRINELPEALSLPAVGEQWHIDYRPGHQRAQLLEDGANRKLIYQCAVHEQAAVLTILKEWLRVRARNVLVPRVHELACEFGFTAGRISIRNQRARWGSCSSKKNLSLNLKLLFLTPAQVRYVLVHELCHTVHLNHSAAFWQLVERCEPQSESLRRSMRSAWRTVPVWV